MGVRWTIVESQVESLGPLTLMIVLTQMVWLIRPLDYVLCHLKRSILLANMCTIGVFDLDCTGKLKALINIYKYFKIKGMNVCIASVRAILQMIVLCHQMLVVQSRNCLNAPHTILSKALLHQNCHVDHIPAQVPVGWQLCVMSFNQLCHVDHIPAQVSVGWQICFMSFHQAALSYSRYACPSSC